METPPDPDLEEIMRLFAVTRTALVDVIRGTTDVDRANKLEAILDHLAAGQEALFEI